MKRQGIAAAAASAALGLGLLFAGSAPAGAPEPPAANIGVNENTAEFTPAEVTVAPGDTVRWTFHPSAVPDGGPIAATHNVAVHDGPNETDDVLDTSPYFSSDGEGGVDPEPGYWDYTFSEEGQYYFVCQVHPGTMFGTVTVKAKTTLKLSAKPKNQTVKASKVAKVTATVKNTGGAPAQKVKVCAKAPKKKLKPRGKKCATFKTLAKGAQKKPAFKFKPKAGAKGKKTTVTITVTAGNAPKKTVKTSIKVPKK